MRRGGGENASKCFLHDLDHWAAHKVFNLSPLCKAELIFLAAGPNSICAKLRGEIYAWNPSYSLFSLFLCSLIRTPCTTLLYRRWFPLDFGPDWSWTKVAQWGDKLWPFTPDAAFWLPQNKNVFFCNWAPVLSWLCTQAVFGPQGDPPPFFLPLAKPQMLKFWQRQTVRHVCHSQTLLKDERREKERLFFSSDMNSQ